MKKELDGAHRSNWEAEEGVRGACGAHALTGGVQKRLRVGQEAEKVSAVRVGARWICSACGCLAKPSRRTRESEPTCRPGSERGKGELAVTSNMYRKPALHLCERRDQMERLTCRRRSGLTRHPGQSSTSERQPLAGHMPFWAGRPVREVPAALSVLLWSLLTYVLVAPCMRIHAVGMSATLSTLVDVLLLLRVWSMLY